MELCKSMVPSLLLTLLFLASSGTGPWMGVNAARDDAITWNEPKNRQDKRRPDIPQDNGFGQWGDDKTAWDNRRDNDRQDTGRRGDTDTWGRIPGDNNPSKKNKKGWGERKDDMGDTSRGKGQRSDQPDRRDGGWDDDTWNNPGDDTYRGKDRRSDESDRKNVGQDDNLWGSPRDDTFRGKGKRKNPWKNGGQDDASWGSPRDDTSRGKGKRKNPWKNGGQDDETWGNPGDDTYRGKDRRSDPSDRKNGRWDDVPQNKGNKGDKGSWDSWNDEDRQGDPQKEKFCTERSLRHQGGCNKESCDKACLLERVKNLHGECESSAWNSHCLCVSRC